MIAKNHSHRRKRMKCKRQSYFHYVLFVYSVVYKSYVGVINGNLILLVTSEYFQSHLVMSIDLVYVVFVVRSVDTL